MNKKIAKKLRKIINPQDAITRRVYRRAKKQYMKTPKALRADFLFSLSHLINSEEV
jgi:hypothetical protein